MNLIQEYLNLAEACASTDYSDEKSVQRHNRSVDRMYEIAEKIGYEDTLETIDDFVKLLDIQVNKTAIWAAVHILDRIPVNADIEQKALNILENAAKDDNTLTHWDSKYGWKTAEAIKQQNADNPLAVVRIDQIYSQIHSPTLPNFI